MGSHTHRTQMTRLPYPYILVFLPCFLATTELPDRVEIQSVRVTIWGDWHRMERCAEGHYAHGVQIKYERDQKSGDDTALNAIALYCNRLDSEPTSDWIMSGEGPYGSWFTIGYCPFGSVIIGFDLRSQAYSNGKDLDQVGADNFAVFCGSVCGPRYNDYRIKGKTAGFGNWSGEQFCPRGYVVCGIRTQIEARMGSGDDTALNNVDLECCRVSSTCSVSLARHAWNTSNSIPGRMQLHSTRITDWGSWYPWARCSGDKLANGMQIKYRANQYNRDNTSLNAVAIFCQELGLNEYRNDDGWMSGEGDVGDWQTIRYCPLGTFIVGFALRSQPYQSHGDNVAADNFAVYCGTVNGARNAETRLQGDTMGVGYWTADQFCPPGYVVCGIQTQIHGIQGKADDTALNNVNLECCKVNLSNCPLKHSMIPIAEFDNRYGNGSVTAKFVKKVSYFRTSGSTRTISNEEKDLISKKFSMGVGRSFESSMTVGYQKDGVSVGVGSQSGLTLDMSQDVSKSEEVVSSEQLQAMVQDAMTHERSETITFTVPAFTRVIIEQMFITCGEYRLGLAKTVSRS